MNENPWHVDDIARMQRERIQEEMREIRMAEAASKAHSPRISLLARILEQIRPVMQPLFGGAKKAAHRPAPQPQVRLQAKPRARG